MDFPSKVLLPMGDLGPYLICGILGTPESAPECHLDRFCRFAGLVNVTNAQTDRPCHY